jgi:predicted  nucleic acid-binding Zn-ribbon protein
LKEEFNEVYNLLDQTKNEAAKLNSTLTKTKEASKSQSSLITSLQERLSQIITNTINYEKSIGLTIAEKDNKIGELTVKLENKELVRGKAEAVLNHTVTEWEKDKEQLTTQLNQINQTIPKLEEDNNFLNRINSAYREFIEELTEPGMAEKIAENFQNYPVKSTAGLVGIGILAQKYLRKKKKNASEEESKKK